MKKKRIFLITITAILFCYLLGYLIYGSKSIFSLFQLSRKKEQLLKENKILEKDKEKLDKKVKGMKTESLDMDMLDEQARKNLGYSKEKEIIYIE